MLILETFRVCAKLLLLGTHTWNGAATEAFVAAGVILAGFYGAKHRDSATLFVCEYFAVAQRDSSALPAFVLLL